MNGYVIVREDGAFVSPPGSAHSYTRNFLSAQVYPSESSARADLCPENERIVPMDRYLDEMRARSRRAY